MDRKTLHLIISGKVQGVGYRTWAQSAARGLNLHGWVRNMDSGEVEALLQGSDVNLGQMIDKCWQGPPAAKVSNILITNIQDNTTFQDIVIRR